MKKVILIFILSTFFFQTNAQIRKTRQNEKKVELKKTDPRERKVINQKEVGKPRQVQTKTRTKAEKEKKEEESKDNSKPGIPLSNAAKSLIDRDKIKTFKEKIVNYENESRELSLAGNNFPTGISSNITVLREEEKNNQVCSRERIDTEIKTTEFKDFTSNGAPDWLKPGIIMEASGMVDGTERVEERYDRNPITISTTARGAIDTYVEVENPRQKSKIEQAVNRLISQDDSYTGALMNFKFHEIHSSEDLNLVVNGRFSAEFGASSIATELGVSNKKEKSHHYYLVEFTQSVFTMEVDGLNKEEVFINNPEVELDDYLYISKVNYGRKGYIMYVADRSLEEIGMEAKVDGKHVTMSAGVDTKMKSLQKSEEVQISAFYYGGTPGSASSDLLRGWDRESMPLKDYIEDSDFSPKYAYPISYEIKNMDNERLGMQSQNKQTVETCTDLPEDLKLKVTLLEIEAAHAGDSDKYADYGVLQHIRYEANGSAKEPIRTDKNTYGGDCSPEGNPLPYFPDAIAMICGNKDKQIHVVESDEPTRSIGNNINNSVTFQITADEAKDSNAKFEILTRVTEYSDTGKAFSKKDIVMNHDPAVTQVAIKDVIATLTGVRTFPEGKKYAGDRQVDQTLDFDDFGGGYLQLRQIIAGDRTILEGPIRARNKGKKVTEKAFLWMRFELVD